jgi:tetratricopeptide (TPR) repeat protein
MNSRRRRGGVRTVVLVVLALGGAGLLAALGWRWRLRQVEAARASRVTAQIEVAPAPLRPGGPLIGAPGKDASGYPLRQVDRALLRSLLWHERFDELTSELESLQQEFEKDWHAEDWIIDAAEALGAPEERVRAKLDGWAASSERSFAPLLVRGVYGVLLGFAQRGGAAYRDTAPEDIQQMRRTLTQAYEDLERAVSLRPRLLPARHFQMRAALGINDLERVRHAYDLSVEICPLCFKPRVTYIKTLRPRWGGSDEAMLRFARAERDRGNPRLKLLPGYVDLDHSEELRSARQTEAALEAIERACALGEHWEFLLQRARLRIDVKQYPAALGDLNRAVALKAREPSILYMRAEALGGAGQFTDAGRDLLAALRVNPTDAQARRLRDYVLKGLLYEAGQHFRADRRREAVEAMTLATELDPTNQDLQGKRASVVSAAGDSGEASLATLRQRAEAAPDDFRSLQEYDYALARRGQYQEVVNLWTGYLARHPNDGRAHLERGGARLNLGRALEAARDARRACELGVNEGCVRANQLGERTSPR